MRLARASTLALIAVALSCATASNNAPTTVTTTAGQPVSFGAVSRWQGPGIAKKLVIVGINDTHGGLLAQTPSKGLAKLGIGDVGGADWFAGWRRRRRRAATS